MDWKLIFSTFSIDFLCPHTLSFVLVQQRNHLYILQASLHLSPRVKWTTTKPINGRRLPSPLLLYHLLMPDQKIGTVGQAAAAAEASSSSSSIQHHRPGRVSEICNKERGKASSQPEIMLQKCSFPLLYSPLGSFVSHKLFRSPLCTSLFTWVARPYGVDQADRRQRRQRPGQFPRKRCRGTNGSYLAMRCVRSFFGYWEEYELGLWIDDGCCVPGCSAATWILRTNLSFDSPPRPFCTFQQRFFLFFPLCGSWKLDSMTSTQSPLIIFYISLELNNSTILDSNNNTI